MQLSVRMQAVADMVTPGSRLADIGTDHAYIPCYLLQKQIIPAAIAMDVRTGPLERANASAEKYCLKDKITLRLSDGLHELNENEADSVVIAGMGGLLMIRILDEGLKVLETVKEIILQPQSDIREVREYVLNHGFCIVCEDSVMDDGKYYVMMKIVHGQDLPYDELSLRYGRYLLEHRNPVYREFLTREYEQNNNIYNNLKLQTSEKSRRRLAEIAQDLDYLKKALDSYR